MGAKSGLGKGLSSLIPEDVNTAALIASGETVEELLLEALQPDDAQPRTNFDEVALQDLAVSIKRYGILQPIVVSPPRAGRYGIIAGERRWRAAKIAGLKKVPALVRSLKQQEKLEVALIENVQRVDLDPLEQAISIERLHQQFNLGYSDIAKRLGKADTTVSNIVRLLKLPPKAQQALRDKALSEGHARQVLALKDMPERQDQLIDLVIAEGWSVRQAEQFAVRAKAEHKQPDATTRKARVETADTKRLSKRYGVPVRLHRTAKGGKLELHFSSDNELEKLLGELTRE